MKRSSLRNRITESTLWNSNPPSNGSKPYPLTLQIWSKEPLANSSAHGHCVIFLTYAKTSIQDHILLIVTSNNTHLVVHPHGAPVVVLCENETHSVRRMLQKAPVWSSIQHLELRARHEGCVVDHCCLSMQDPPHVKSLKQKEDHSMLEIPRTVSSHFLTLQVTAVAWVIGPIARCPNRPTIRRGLCWWSAKVESKMGCRIQWASRLESHHIF